MGVAVDSADTVAVGAMADGTGAGTEVGPAAGGGVDVSVGSAVGSEVQAASRRTRATAINRKGNSAGIFIAYLG